MASLAAQSPTDRRPSPLLSNNPFRNRDDPPSPALPSPSISTLSANGRPTSKNPFLDSTDLAAPAPVKTMAPQPVRPYAGENTTELLENLSLSDGPQRRADAPPPYQGNGPSNNPGNMPPRSRHAPSQSEEERRRYRPGPKGTSGEVNVFADPSDKPREHRLRRNSDTSVRDKSSKLLEPTDDRRRRERRHRDPRRDGHGKSSSRKLDVIDKLDVTSIYGTGLFHHDGPFDACNPHRNRKGSRAAPMQAFPKGSRNMALGGSGPVNSNIDLAQFHGRGEEGYNDYSTSAAVDEFADTTRRPGSAKSSTFHPVTRVEPVHGEESMGLGTSTFLEGAPASRTAIHRRESDLEEPSGGNAGGLGRKKSLAMKIRGMSNHRAGGAGTTSPVVSPLATGHSDHAASRNPFFTDYEQDHDKRGAQVTFAEEKQGRTRAPSSPKRPFPSMERRTTTENVRDEPKTGPSGFLSRVRSLKSGPRKPRADRREPS